jgi:hypothetical protein
MRTTSDSSYCCGGCWERGRVDALQKLSDLSTIDASNFVESLIYKAPSATKFAN